MHHWGPDASNHEIAGQKGSWVYTLEMIIFSSGLVF